MIWIVVIALATLVQFTGIAIAGSSYHRILLLAAVITAALIVRRLGRRSERPPRPTSPE